MKTKQEVKRDVRDARRRHHLMCQSRSSKREL